MGIEDGKFPKCLNWAASASLKTWDVMRLAGGAVVCCACVCVSVSRCKWCWEERPPALLLLLSTRTNNEKRKDTQSETQQKIAQMHDDVNKR